MRLKLFVSGEINLGSDYKSMYQSPGYNLSYGLTFTFDSQSISDDEGEDLGGDIACLLYTSDAADE